MRGANRHFVVLVALMLLTTIFYSQIPVSAESDECEQGLACDWIKTGPNSNIVVIQEITAIWCEICATTDITIQEFTDQRNQEVARIAYHPDDGLDYLGNRLSTRQMWNLGENPTEAEFPTIWMDGGNRASGPTTNDQLQRNYLKAAGQRTTEDTIEIEYFNHVSNWSGEGHQRLEFITTITGENSDKITLVLKENAVQIENPQLYNGVSHHDDVATSGVMVNSNNGTIIFSEPSDAWRIVDLEINENFSKFQIFYDYNASSIIDDDLMVHKGLVAYTENSEGKIIAALHIESANQNLDDENISIIIITGVAIIGIILATSILNNLKDSKLHNEIKNGAESEE